MGRGFSIAVRDGRNADPGTLILDEDGTGTAPGRHRCPNLFQRSVELGLKQ
jgi:hypothetical protein